MGFSKYGFLKNFLLFLLRQIYRIFFVLPFQLVVPVVLFFSKIFNSKVVERVPYCFIITSVIYPKPDKQIHYNAPRSVFSPEDRAKQTQKTIESIRAQVPGAKIILVESGLQKIVPFDLDKKVDQYIYVGDTRLVRWSCDSKQKSLGEIMMLFFAIKVFKYKADFYFKMSGRYFLNEEFNLEGWRHGEFVLQYIKSDYICTRLYGFKATAFSVWQRALLKGIPLAMIAYPIENTLAKYIPRDRVYSLHRLGVSGIGASSNDIIKD
jgi:hypothetical protein